MWIGIMNNNKLTNKELALINNIINKLQIDMEKSNQTLYSLSTTLGFEYQPFYRLIKNKKLPTISTLAMITEHFQCSIEELISDKVYIDIHVINNLDEISTLSSNIKKAKISLPIKDYLPYIHNEIFAVKIEELQKLGIEYCKIYFKTEQINDDGIYITFYQNKITQLNVTSTSSKFLIVEFNNQEQRIPREEIQPIAKFFNEALLFKSNNNYTQGVIK